MVHRKFKIILLDLSFHFIENCLIGVLHDSVLLEWTFRFIEYCLIGFVILLRITCGLFSLSGGGGGGRQTTLFSGPGEYSPWRPGSTPPLGNWNSFQVSGNRTFRISQMPRGFPWGRKSNTNLQGPEVCISVPADLGPRNTRVFVRLKT